MQDGVDPESTNVRHSFLPPKWGVKQKEIKGIGNRLLGGGGETNLDKRLGLTDWIIDKPQDFQAAVQSQGDAQASSTKMMRMMRATEMTLTRMTLTISKFLCRCCCNTAWNVERGQVTCLLTKNTSEDSDNNDDNDNKTRCGRSHAEANWQDMPNDQYARDESPEGDVADDSSSKVKRGAPYAKRHAIIMTRYDTKEIAEFLKMFSCPRWT